MDNTTIIDLYFARDEAAIRHTAEKYGGRLRALSDILIEAPETETYRVQEEHIKLYHELCARVEAAFFAE